MQAISFTCANCERPIGRLEQPKELGTNIICADCYEKLHPHRATRTDPAAAKPLVASVRRNVTASGVVAVLVILAAVGLMVHAAFRAAGPGDSPLMYLGILAVILAVVAVGVVITALLWRSGPFGKLLVLLWIFGSDD